MKNRKFYTIFLIIICFVFSFTLLATTIFLLFDIKSNNEALTFGARVAGVVVTFSTFVSQSFFSLLLFINNRTISKINSDTNVRAETFRNLSFISANYSLIEFNDRMLLSIESDRYVNKLVQSENDEFHMVLDYVNIKDVYQSPSNYQFITVRIPFSILEGKTVSSITLERITFERNLKKFRFIFSNSGENPAFLLFNENTRRRNMIINLIYPKDSDFFVLNEISNFTKIKIRMSIISILGVKIKGISELFFTNPVLVEGDLSNIYKITSSIFTISESPKLIDSFTID